MREKASAMRLRVCSRIYVRPRTPCPLSQRHVFIRALWFPTASASCAQGQPKAQRAKAIGGECSFARNLRKNVDGGYIAAVLYVTMTAHTPHTPTGTQTHTHNSN
ncbi:hypothetical protein F4677DRAFT_421029 [Hypoxylon crocopeplum]|nr:hypothetical protein F4677DRAFT_421029 [Hypoxylon crocopeplum]